ncbi:MAG: glycosyltransferase, partial [Patescibacteria group bacterium]
EGIIEFVGPIPNKNIVEFYQSGDLFVNLSDTGSLDKAVLEAMACGLKVLTSNEAFKNIVPEENFTSNRPQEIAEKIEKLGETGHANMVNFAEYAAKNHGLYSLVGKIINFFA